MKPALLIVDMQKEFSDDKPQPFREKLLPNVAAALNLARSAGVPVIHVITRYRRDKSDWPKAWRHRDSIHCLEGTDSVQILDEARPLPGEPVVVKKRFSGFYETTLEIVLGERGIDTLFVAGYSSDVCVRMAAMDAFNRNDDLYLLSDCVHADREDTEESIRYLRWLTNLRPITNNELATILEGHKLSEG